MTESTDARSRAQLEFTRTREEAKRLHREYVKTPPGSEMRKQLSKKHGDAARAHQKAVDALKALDAGTDDSA